jgi:hypothetical protein
MKPKIAALLVVSIAMTFAISIQAQEMGWDNDEEVQRLEHEQTEEAEQGEGPVETEATGVPTPSKITSGEKKAEEWEAIPTGFAKREYIIRQQNMAGKWTEANIFPASNDEPRWFPITSVQYADALQSGLVDARLKETVYGPYYENMRRICATGPSAKDVHVKSPDSSPEWRMGQRMQRPYTLNRQLSFDCLIKSN